MYGYKLQWQRMMKQNKTYVQGRSSIIDVYSMD